MRRMLVKLTSDEAMVDGVARPGERIGGGVKMRDLIFVSLEDWDDVWRRNQFLCAALARRFPEIKILFVGLPRNVSNDLRRGNLRALRNEATTRLGAFPEISGSYAVNIFARL